MIELEPLISMFALASATLLMVLAGRVQEAPGLAAAASALPPPTVNVGDQDPWPVFAQFGR